MVQKERADQADPPTGRCRPHGLSIGRSHDAPGGALFLLTGLMTGERGFSQLPTTARFDGPPLTNASNGIPRIHGPVVDQAVPDGLHGKCARRPAADVGSTGRPRPALDAAAH
jgi:hypothetical protein